MSMTSKNYMDLKHYAEQTPLDIQQIQNMRDLLEEAVQFQAHMENAKRQRKRDRIDKFLGLQRRFLVWAFRAKEVTGRLET